MAHARTYSHTVHTYTKTHMHTNMHAYVHTYTHAHTCSRLTSFIGTCVFGQCLKVCGEEHSRENAMSIVIYIIRM